MPLVRFQVRNEYSLGQPQLYKEVNREDPKAVLDGVAVSGLVGILRQLGDLAEFAAEVFHGLQEQVMTTASRSHKLMVRVQHIEAAVPPLEKAVLAQTSHIHFAYTSGIEWHPRIRNEKNHFIYNDLPRFIMDSYEGCRDRPRLDLLDKFDTGGPGSCLKRYSDPTFFKKASAIPDEENVEKVRRSRKAQRSKKKRGSQRKGDVLRGASASNRSSRMQYISPIVNGRSSSSQTASTADMGLKSDLGDNSTSFDSRTESGYIEYAAHPSSSMQGEEHESKESPTSKLVQHVDTIDSVSPADQTGFVDDNSPGSSLQDQVTSGSSCVNWDEKTEIVDPKCQQNSIDETTEMHPTKDNLDAHEAGAGNFRIVERMDALFDDENIVESISSSNQTDEIESQPDNFMDALNIIESESETDLDCQTKREVEHVASVVNNEGPYGVHETSHDCLDDETPIFESHTSTSYISSEVEVPTDLPSSASSESPIHKQVPQIDMEPSNPNHAVGTNRADIFYGSRLESVSGDSVSSGSGTTNLQDKTISSLYIPQESPADVSRTSSTSPSSGTTNDQDKTISSLCEAQESPADDSSNNSTPSVSGSGTTSVKDKITSSLCGSQESPADIYRNNSINFWTNGGLLGLQPSKPPDFSMSSPISQDSANRNHTETVGLSNHAYKHIVDEHESEESPLVENAGSNDKDLSSKCSISCSENQDDGISFKKIPNGFSPTELYPKLRNIGDSHTIEPGTVLPVAPYGKSTSNEVNQEKEENSSWVFGLGRRLLVNDFGRKIAHVHDDGSEPTSYSDAGVLDRRNKQQRVEDQAFPETSVREPFEDGIGVDSSPSSPPLEHMKISFHPVDGIETSILKLKLSDGNQSHESARDMFQSFQLIPEPAVPLHEFVSDSDGDTFCRSSPYISDDCHSHLSESNSEQWESGETLERNNHELYDGLCRISLEELYDGLCGISSEEHISTSPILDGISHNATYVDGGSKSVHNENGLEHYSLSDPLLDLPSFDALEPVLQQEAKDDSGPKDLPGLRCSEDYTPGSPPLPPVEWRASKPFTVEKDVFKGFRHALNAEVLGSVTLQQPKPAPVQQQQMNEDSIKPQDKQDQHVNGQKDTDQDLNGKGADEKEDFLQQIRTKSFNLRRTVPAKAAATPAPAANVKVTAILEKANAIRQAVGSDDDTWSDT
ncbi:hypothetical protein ACFX13_004941 [Malus domestica]